MQDAIRRAGGATRARTSQAINLAATVQDGVQIVVPRAAATARRVRARAWPAAAGRRGRGPINLNTATAGAARDARRRRPGDGGKILDYRKQHGGFRSVEDSAGVGHRPEAPGGAARQGDSVSPSDASRPRGCAGAASARRAAIAAGAARGRLAEAASDHPRHLVLGAMLTGLLLGPRVGAGEDIVLGACGAALAVRLVPLAHARAVAPMAALLLAGASLLAHDRAAALDHTRLSPLFGTVVAGEATLLSAPRPRRLRRAPRARPLARRAAAAAPADLGAGRGQSGPRGPRRPRRSRRRTSARSCASRPGWRAGPGREAALHAHATLRATEVIDTGRGRGGVLGLVDGVRRRAESKRHNGVVLVSRAGHAVGKPGGNVGVARYRPRKINSLPAWRRILTDDRSSIRVPGRSVDDPVDPERRAEGKATCPGRCRRARCEADRLEGSGRPYPRN